MKTIIYFMLMIAAFSSCNTGSKETSSEMQKDSKKAEAGIALDADTDPICGMSVKNSYSDTTLYNGKIYGFCNPACKEEFLKNPEQHIK